MSDKMDEKVAVLPRALFEGFNFPGITSRPQDMNQFYLLMQQVAFKRRGDVEEDESWLQVIPYMYVYDKDRDIVFTYRRSVKSGEKRLHGKTSIGIGGHINLKDCFSGKLALLGTAAYRELHEEIVFTPPYVPEHLNMCPVGLMLLDTSPVDRVHLGVVIRVEYIGVVTPNDEEIEDYQWIPREGLLEFELENWSRVVAEYLQKNK